MTNENTIKQVKRILGIIVSHATPKTAVVKVATFKVHPKYKKRYRVSKRYLVHDAEGQFTVGDMVEIVPSRPLSRRKRFLISRKVIRPAEREQ